MKQREKIIEGHKVTFAAAETLLHVRFKDQVTYDSLSAFAETLYNDPDYNQNWDILIEMRLATFDLSFSDLLNYTNGIAKDPRRILGATAIVSPSLLHFGIGRMYGSIVGDRLGKVRIERALDPALAWLQTQRDLRKKT
jgi:hypothetical protein